MPGIQRRLRKIEEDLIPKERFAVFYAREESKEEDIDKQKKEYYERYGDKGKVIFIILRDYSFEKGESYEEFIQRKRSGTQRGNCFTDWYLSND